VKIKGARNLYLKRRKERGEEGNGEGRWSVRAGGEEERGRRNE